MYFLIVKVDISYTHRFKLACIDVSVLQLPVAKSKQKEVHTSILVYYLVILKFTWYMRCWSHKNIICATEHHCNTVDDYAIITIKKNSCITTVKSE